jgi:hypothetical protein
MFNQVDDEEIIARALRAYRRRPLLRSSHDGVGGDSDRLSLAGPVGVPWGGAVVHHNGRPYVIVENRLEVLAVYAVRSGRLRRLARWPW